MTIRLGACYNRILAEVDDSRILETKKRIMREYAVIASFIILLTYCVMFFMIHKGDEEALNTDTTSWLFVIFTILLVVVLFSVHVVSSNADIMLLPLIVA